MTYVYTSSYCNEVTRTGANLGDPPMAEGLTKSEQKVRRDALQDARRAAVKAVMTTAIDPSIAITEAPMCHRARCGCDSYIRLESLMTLLLTAAAEEVDRALALEWDEDLARLDHQRDAWDEGYMHVMKHGTGRNTRDQNPYLRPDDL